MNHADLVNPDLVGRLQGGMPDSFDHYFYTYTPGLPDREGRITTYTITARSISHTITGRAVPKKPNEPGGVRSFFTDESARIRVTHEDRAATAQDLPL